MSSYNTNKMSVGCSSKSLQTHLQILVLIAVCSILFEGSTVDANVKKVLLQLPKKPKQVHHHHHYLLMDPVQAGASQIGQIGRFEHNLPRPTSPHMGPNNIRPFHGEMGLPYHVPIYLGHSSEPHGDFMDQHPFMGGNNMRHIDTIMGYNVVPPPSSPPIPPPPPLKKQKIIRKMPMKMDTMPNNDYFNDGPLYSSFSNDHPLVIHKAYPDHHTGYKIHQNYNPNNVVQHIFTEEIQTDFK